MHDQTYIHPSCDISPSATIGAGTKIWNYSKIREDAIIGPNCVIGQGVYIDTGVEVGAGSKIQNGVSIFQGVRLARGVFCGPECVFTNDLTPRAVNADLQLKTTVDWEVVFTQVEEGASIGANATIIGGNRIGRWAVIGAGSVVTSDVASFSIVVGNPARAIGFACFCGKRLSSHEDGKFVCGFCHSQFVLDHVSQTMTPA